MMIVKEPGIAAPPRATTAAGARPRWRRRRGFRRHREQMARLAVERDRARAV